MDETHQFFPEPAPSDVNPFPEPKTSERSRAVKRKQDRRRRERIRANGPQDDCTFDEIAERDHWTCALCGEPVERQYNAPDPRTASLDHIKDVALGGTDTRDNVRLTHLFCNQDKRLPSSIEGRQSLRALLESRYPDVDFSRITDLPERTTEETRDDARRRYKKKIANLEH
ncbi:HNH endonuclease [Haloechinothrix sp. YIM 98757]|uniref:HNH endonuclease n=1 Tax=Haloechinothrix aidingensis TaxID=2752311 RepID=A0A838A8J7_9PSEU|nr:HNH endonuclease [Haloechinothrix aidingensis]MBA0125087.1 HNH endonuclease [Haloechinothrix aidingensis]